MNQYGITVHRIIRSFEELSAGFQARGLGKVKADRLALLHALRLEGWPYHEAMKFVDSHISEKK
jgi:hypothetical protein